MISEVVLSIFASKFKLWGEVWPRCRQDGPKIAQRWLKMLPTCAKKKPRWAKKPKMAKRWIKMG